MVVRADLEYSIQDTHSLSGFSGLSDMLISDILIGISPQALCQDSSTEERSDNPEINDKLKSISNLKQDDRSISRGYITSDVKVGKEVPER